VEKKKHDPSCMVKGRSEPCNIDQVHSASPALLDAYRGSVCAGLQHLTGNQCSKLPLRCKCLFFFEAGFEADSAMAVICFVVS
jgi:hypothetical protein